MDFWKFVLLITFGMVIILQNLSIATAYSCPEVNVDFDFSNIVNGMVPWIKSWHDCGKSLMKYFIMMAHTGGNLLTIGGYHPA